MIKISFWLVVVKYNLLAERNNMFFLCELVFTLKIVLPKAAIGFVAEGEKIFQFLAKKAENVSIFGKKGKKVILKAKKVKKVIFAKKVKKNGFFTFFPSPSYLPMNIWYVHIPVVYCTVPYSTLNNNYNLLVRYVHVPINIAKGGKGRETTIEGGKTA